MKYLYSVSLIIIAMLLFTLGIVGCEPIEKYTLTVINNTDFVTSCPDSGKYKPGQKWEIKTDVITDVGIYIYANNKPVPKSHYDSDYWGFEFTMPEEDVELVITMDQFYGKTNYTFDSLFYQTRNLKIENVDAIWESSYNSNSKMKTILKSTDKEDIKNILSILNESLIIVRDETIDLNSSEFIEYSFIQEDNNSFELIIINGYVFWNDFSSSEIFRFERNDWTLPRVENESEIFYKFTNSRSSYSYYSNDETNIELGRYNSLDLIEFQVSNIQLNEDKAKIYIDAEFFGKIYCVDAKTFILDDVTYEIIIESDFRELFEEN